MFERFGIQFAQSQVRIMFLHPLKSNQLTGQQINLPKQIDHEEVGTGTAFRRAPTSGLPGDVGTAFHRAPTSLGKLV